MMKNISKKLVLKKEASAYMGRSKKKSNKKHYNFISSKYNLNKTFNILFVGRLIKEKGVLDALKIFKLIRVPEKD